MIPSQALYRLYEWRLAGQVAKGPLPGHVAMVMDGNRRWAAQEGFEDPSVGHHYGAKHIEPVLGWCALAGIKHVTIYVASIDNLRKRDAEQVSALMDTVEGLVATRLAAPDSPWRVHLAGQLDELPGSVAEALLAAKSDTADRDTGFNLTLAVGYDGRQEIVDAVKSLVGQEAEAGTTLEDLAQTVTPQDIASHLYTKDQPYPDLVIRTSGEQRFSGFLLWQSTHSELYFCDVYWPGFRRIDFLRALRGYAARRRAKA